MTLMMTVSGIRGIIGRTMTPTLAAELGATFGSHVSGGQVVLGRDSRPSGEMVCSAVSAGLLATGCHVVDLGIVSTPGVAVMVLERGASGGIVVTASHNPAVWNGIKFITSRGGAPFPDEAENILDRYRNKAFTLVDVDHVGRHEHDTSTHEKHAARILALLNGDAICGRRFKVVLDSVNGAGGAGGRVLLERLGCEVIHVNAEATGRFAHPPEPTEENLTGLCEAVREHGADLGFAQDPDADRLAIVDDRGRYIGEEYTVALAARHVFKKRPGPVAVNLSTSRMIDDVAERVGEGIVVHRTPVGEANVARTILEHECVIGGEGNGGVIDPRVSAVRDSFVAMGMILDLLADEQRPLSSIVDEMPRYVMLKKKVELGGEAVRSWLERLSGVAADGCLNDTDGLRIDWPEGWVHVRPSNTEPIARVIAEAADRETAERLVKRATDLL